METKFKFTQWSLYVKEQIKKEIGLYLEFNDNGEVSMLWDALKAVLRGEIIALSSYKKKKRNKEQEDLQNKLKELERKHKIRQTQDALEEIKKIT